MTMLSVNTNVGALFAAHSSYKVNKSMETSMARLSSGKRINSAADDAADIQIVSRMDSEIRGLNQAVRNASDAQALLMTTEGALDEVHTSENERASGSGLKRYVYDARQSCASS